MFAPNMRQAIVFGVLVSMITIAILGCTSCANIIPPQGGPRDSLPPVLVNANPPDSTVNFSGNRIVLTFNENLDDLIDTRENIVFSPTFENNPQITVRAKTITIPFPDSLLPNTTYVLNFGNSIADFNERNVLRNFVYTFSTGPALDSLEITGRVELAETGGIDSTLTAILHLDLRDSAVVEKTPPYVVRLNSRGEFRFRNLPAKTFALYIIGDATNTGRRYIRKNQLFAFRDAPVVAGQTDSLVLYAYREMPANPQQGPPTAAGGVLGRATAANDRRLRFTPSGAQQDLEKDYVLSFPVPLRSYDSTRISLSTDSTYTPVPFSVSLDTSETQLSISTAWKENTRYNLVLEQDFAADTSGRQLLKTDTLNFTNRKLAD